VTGTLDPEGREFLPFTVQWDENLDLGSDTGSPVDDKDYRVPFEFTKRISRFTLTIDRCRLSPEARRG
jgi:arylsulfatase